MAMTAPEKRDPVLPSPQCDPVAADAVIYRGALVCLNSSGDAVPATATTGLIARGIAWETRDATGLSAGDLFVTTKQGVFLFNNKSGDELSQDEVGDVCYASADNEVCKTSTSKSVAGVVCSIQGDEVAVAVGLWPLQVGLLAANNLSDVGSAATARSNLGANLGHFVGEKVSSKGADAEVFRWVAGSAGSITKLYTVINAALATGDATVQLKINGSNVGSTTTGLVTITQSGSAAGDVDVATPLTTNLTFAAGDVISITVGGASTATATLNATVEYTF